MLIDAPEDMAFLQLSPAHLKLLIKEKKKVLYVKKSKWRINMLRCVQASRTKLFLHWLKSM